MHLFLRRTLLLFAPLVTAYPPPELCEGWCFKDLRDPAVVLKDNTFYRFTTHHNFTISTAPSIAGPWTKEGVALENGTLIDMPLPKPKAGKNGDHLPIDKGPMLWAPDVLLVGDTYYMTYSATRGGKPNEIGIATSKTLQPGSWTDHGRLALPQNEHYNRIDSNLFLPSPGSAPILAVGSYLRGLFQVPMTLPPMQLNGHMTHIAYNKSNDAIEAAYQFQWTSAGKQWYYLFFSSGRCCNPPNELPPTGDEYKVMVCRSASPTGPFVDDHGTPCVEGGGRMILGTHDDVYGPGGQGVLYDEQLKMPVMYYHYMNKSTGYNVEDVYFGWNKLKFDSGWPVLVGEGDDGEDSAKKPPTDESGTKSSAATSNTIAAMHAALTVCLILVTICGLLA